ncbi:sensor histidine kinase [Actinoplanes solisilvae]|uniref:sensor histidine kinase n=1 Tax=Actinoplanes solisilvae TaxID=2486853 RepID=UPI00196B8B0B|nr:sensor histidine kinase [Actinoplanes solisilvae]
MIDNVRRRWTSQHWFASVLVAMVLLIAVATFVGAELLARTTEVSNRLNDHIAPARTAAAELTAAVVDQETGVRGYLLSGDDQFLEPYASGVATEEQLVAEIRRLLLDEPLPELDLVVGQMREWRDRTANPLIDSREQAGVPGELVAGSKAAFDAVRAPLDALDDRLQALRDAGRADLEDSRSARNTAFLFLVVALLLLIALIAVLLRVVVLRPLTDLGGAVRRVADGDFDHRLTPGGPADLARLGEDVEAMRRRLVGSLEASRLQAAELHRSNTDLEQFAYVASHDLQEPLRKVASFCQMLQRRYSESLDDRAQQYISFAVDGATRMQQLINDLLAFSRIGRLHADRSPIDLDAVLDRVTDSLALRIEETGATITRPPMPVVPGDATLLTQLWQNLIGNAIKFRRPDVAPKVVVTAELSDEMWTFEVRDNGIGIDPEFAEKIFVIFQRLHPRDVYAGTGIGLAICKKIVEYHGGAIHLDTGYAEGAGLIFTLPATAKDAMAKDATTKSAAA